MEHALSQHSQAFDYNLPKNSTSGYAAYYLSLFRETESESKRFIIFSTSNLHYTRGITLKRVTSGVVHLRGYRQENTAPKKHRSGAEPLTTLCSIRPARESNQRPPASIAMSLTTTPTGRLQCTSNLKIFTLITWLRAL